MKTFLVATSLCIIAALLWWFHKRQREPFAQHTSSLWQNKTLLVVGGTRGIGFAVAKRALKQGAKHVIITGRTQESVSKAVQRLKGMGSVFGLHADLADPHVRLPALTVSSVDIMLYCAASVTAKRLDANHREAWLHDWNVTVHGFLYAVQAYSPFMSKAETSQIIAMGSGAEAGAPPGYILQKAALRKLVALLANASPTCPPAITCFQLEETVCTRLAKEGLQDKCEATTTLPKVVDMIEAFVKLPCRTKHGETVSSTQLGFVQSLLAKLPSLEPLLARSVSMDVVLPPPDPADEGANPLSPPELAHYPRWEEAEPLLKFLGAGTGENTVAIFPGTLATLDTIANQFVAPGQGTILHTLPDWPQMVSFMQTRHYALSGVRLGLEEAHNPWSTLLKHMTPHTHMIYLTSPHFATGRHLDTAAFHDFMTQLPTRCMVVIDQCYLEFSYKGGDFSAHVNKYTNLIVVRSLSKFHGLAALRITYTLSHPATAAVLRTHTQHQPFLTPQTIRHALHVLNDRNFHERVRTFTREEKERLTQALKQAGITVVDGSVSNVLLIKHSKGTLWDGYVSYMLRDKERNDRWLKEVTQRTP